MPHDYPFTEGSFWPNRPAALAPALVGDARADIAIVGGGITGLSTALALRAKGVDVALLETEFCGAGASGRNAGHVTPTIGKDLPTCLKTFGAERGMRLAHFGEAAVACFEDTIGRLGIGCDYVRAGNVVAGVHESQRKRLEASARSAEKHGIHMNFLDEPAMRQRGLPPSFRFGVHEAAGGIMNPGKYVQGLRAAALEAGVRIHESTPVRRIAQGSEVTLTTDGGCLRAGRAMLATAAYTHSQFGYLRSKIIPVRVTLFVTRRLSDAERASLVWPNQEGVYTAHELLENYRFTDDNRLLGGSKTIIYGYGGALPPADQAKQFALLAETFKIRFPMLRGVPIERFWGGPIALTLDFLPFWGWLGKGEKLAYFAGCNGHGVPQCTLMGQAMADLLRGVNAPLIDLLRRFVPPLPPEPLRMLLFKTLSAFYARPDRAVDRELARAAS